MSMSALANSASRRWTGLRNISAKYSRRYFFDASHGGVKTSSGGGGLVSTLGDYTKFVQMLLAGGSLNGHRFLSRNTLDFMFLNHLPDGKTIKEMALPGYSEAEEAGIG